MNSNTSNSRELYEEYLLGRLVQQIENVQIDAVIFFDKCHETLEEKKKKMKEDLDKILEEFKKVVSKTTKDIKTFRKNKLDLIKEIKQNEANLMLKILQSNVSRKIAELEQKMEKPPEIKLVTNFEAFETKLEECCKISLTDNKEFPPYSERVAPIFSIGTQGTTTSLIQRPAGLEVDSNNGEIYVADELSHQILIFSNSGLHLTTIKSPTMKFPYNMVITCEYLYVACNIARDGRIIKINKASHQTELDARPGQELPGLALDRDNNRLIGCAFANKVLIQFSLKNLKRIGRILINPDSYINGSTKAEDICITSSEIIVLFVNCIFPLQSFSRRGQLLGIIIYTGLNIGAVYHFRIDSQNNFMLTDYNKSKIFVYSYSGDLIATIGNNVLIGPLGIAVTPNKEIVVCDTNVNGCLKWY